MWCEWAHCHEEPTNFHFAISLDVFVGYFPVGAVENFCSNPDW
jgi:hypothetical protein